MHLYCVQVVTLSLWGKVIQKSIHPPRNPVTAKNQAAQTSPSFGRCHVPGSRMEEKLKIPWDIGLIFKKVFWKVRARSGMLRHARACPGMPGCPGREPQTSPGGGPTTMPSNQEPTRSPWPPITAEPTFSSLYGSPAWAIKPFPTPHTWQTSFASQTAFTSLLTRPGSSAQEPWKKRPWSTVHRGGSFFPRRFLHIQL